jgi:AhpD family alkylhydroperoxidase
MSTPRITALEFRKYAPAVGDALAALGKAIAASGLEEELLQLIKLRASQLNGCAFCTQLHINESRHMGMAAPKIDLLAVWREAGIFSPREQAALQWTELLTHLSAQHITDADYAAVSAHFQPAELAWISSAIALINTWNRLAAPFQYAPPIPHHDIQPLRKEVQEPAHA